LKSQRSYARTFVAVSIILSRNIPSMSIIIGSSKTKLMQI
jgi:hypothetical protein